MSQNSGHHIRAASQFALLGGLVALWCLVWGQVTVLTIVTGVILAVVISLLFYLPAIDLSGRVNVWYLLVFFVRLIIDIARASSTRGTSPRALSSRFPSTPGPTSS